MTERLSCSNPACSGTILPSTADKTGGLCMRCVNEQRAAARQREIETNRVTIDRFADVEDPVEIIKLLHEQPPFDLLKVYEPYPQSRAQVYQSLTAAEQQQLVQYAIERLEDENDVGEEVAKCLACFTQTDLEPVCGEPMLFVGQLASEDYVELGEGIFYAFLCRDCRLATANYQQT